MDFRLMLRRILAPALLLVSLPLAAQKPPKLESLPELPPPPPGVSSEQPGEPPVRIHPGGGDQVEEQLIYVRRVVRVTTPLGKEYYLIEDLVYGLGLRNEFHGQGVQVPVCGSL